MWGERNRGILVGNRLFSLLRWFSLPGTRLYLTVQLMRRDDVTGNNKVRHRT